MTSTCYSLASLRYDERPRPAPLTVGGKFNVRAIMRSAIGTARMVLGPKVTRSRTMTWRSAMRIGLAAAWKDAKDELARIARDAAFYAAAKGPHNVCTPAAPEKLQLDRSAAIRVLTAIQNRHVNRGRDILTITGFMSDLDEVLAHARAEFRPLSPADRAAVLEVARAAARPSRPVLVHSREDRPRPHTFDRGSRIHSHGW